MILSFDPRPRFVARLAHVAGIVGPAFMIRWLVGGLSYYALVLGLALWHARRVRLSLWSRETAGVVLLYYTFFILGVGGIWNAIGHSVLADQVARSIGWPVGSPFQLELAAAHLGWALLALSVLWLHRDAMATLVITKAVFLFGAAAVHIHDLTTRGNTAPGNAGFAVLVFGDLLVPAATLVLLGLSRSSAGPAVERQS